MRRAITALVVLTLGQPAVASPCTSEPRPCYLHKGERATFDGELWPSAFALAVLEDRAAAERAQAELEQARADLAAALKLRQVDRDEAAAVLAAERAARRATEDLARALVEPPAWYESPGFLIPVTAVLTVGATVAVFFAAKEL